MELSIIKIPLNIFVCLSITLSALAGTPSNQNFADWLRLNGEYNRAISEYLRIIHADTSEAWRSYSVLSISRCYIDNIEYLRSIDWAKVNIGNVKNAYLDSLRFHIGEAYFYLGNFKKAENEFLSLSTMEGTSLKNEALYWSGLSKIGLQNIEDARRDWSKVGVNSRLFENAKKYSEISDTFHNIEFKNPKKAALYGLIPGMGYYYSEHNETAISAFIVIGLMCWGTERLISKDIYGFGLLTGFITLGWYSGSIYGSYKASQRMNNLKIEQFQSQYKEFIRSNND